MGTIKNLKLIIISLSAIAVVAVLFYFVLMPIYIHSKTSNNLKSKVTVNYRNLELSEAICEMEKSIGVKIENRLDAGYNAQRVMFEADESPVAYMIISLERQCNVCFRTDSVGKYFVVRSDSKDNTGGYILHELVNEHGQVNARSIVERVFDFWK